MPFFPTSDQWLEQSSLLLQARPTTARITTTYKIQNPTSSASKPTSTKSRKRKADGAHPAPSTDQATSTTASETPAVDPSTTAPPTAPKAILTLKTYDPVSGVCLKYKTDKAAEVGRLIASLGRLGRRMAALPEEGDGGIGEAKEDAAGAGVGEQDRKDGATTTASTPATGGGGAGTGGGAKKKKKGKK